MNRIKIFCVAFALTASVASVGHAQFASDQPKSLKGIKTVMVSFSESNAKMDPPLRQEMFDAAILELRKSGIKVVRDNSDESAPDALLNLTVIIVTGLGDIVQVRMDVEQKVVVARTSDKLQLVTWYFEDLTQVGSWRTTAKPMALKGINKFISDWLDANNR